MSPVGLQSVTEVSRGEFEEVRRSLYTVLGGTAAVFPSFIALRADALLFLRLP